MKKIFPFIFSLLLILSCSLPDTDNQEGFSLSLSFTDGFQLINPMVETNKLYLVYEESVDGDFQYILSDSNLGIETSADFIASDREKQNFSADSGTETFFNFVNVINAEAGNSTWVFPETDYYLWVYSPESDEVIFLECSVPANEGSRIETGILSDDDGESIEYHISFPAEYSGSSGDWPLVLCVQAPDFVERNSHFPAVCVYIPTGHTSDGIKNQVPGLVQDVISENRIDTNRIYAWGYSAGGNDVLIYANENNNSLFSYKSVVAIGISNWMIYHNEELGDVNTWFFYGEFDSTYGVTTTNVYNDLPEGSGEHLLTMIPGKYHGDSNNPPWQNPHVWNWLFQ